MAASITINGVTQRVAVLPYGVTVTLTNAAAVGSSQKWEILDYPLDLDDAGPDFATNFPTWTVAGDGTYFINQTPAFTAVTFKPDVTGPYLIRLTSVEAGTPIVSTAVIRVADVHSGEFLAAANETTESGTREGWKRILNGRYKRLAKRMQGDVRVINVSGSTIARGKVVRLAGVIDAHTVTPSVNPGGTASAKPEKLLTIVVADNTSGQANSWDYAILDETLANNASGWAKKLGLFEGKTDVNYSAYVPGTKVYFDNTGTQLPSAPVAGFKISIGTVLDATSTGAIAVRQSEIGALDAAVATWPRANNRYFAVDYDAGNDLNPGFSDISQALAGAVAKKTWAGFLAILPTQGLDRSFQVAIKPRASSATYLDQDATPAALRLIGITGYNNIRIVGTSDFSESAADFASLGFTTIFAGPGVGGVWTTAPGATGVSLSVSSGTLPASSGASLKRIRFTGNVTGILANVCRQVFTNNNTSITIIQDLSPAPASGDTFVIEEPSVVFDSVQINTVPCRSSLQIAGVASANAFSISNSASVVVACCEQRTGGSTNISTCDSFILATGITRIGGAGPNVGFGFASFFGGIAFTGIRTLRLACYGTGVGVPVTYRNVLETLQNACLVRGLTTIAGCGVNTADELSGAGFFFGRASGGFRDHRIDGDQLVVSQSNILVKNVEIINAGSKAAVELQGYSMQVALVGVSGSSGNLLQGVNVTNLKNSVVRLSGSSVSGSTGQIAATGIYSALYSDLDLSNFQDVNGNRISGGAGLIVDVCSGFTNVDGSSVGLGEIVRVSATNNVVRALADTEANAKGGLWVAVTSPANNALGFFVPLASAQKWVLHAAAPTLTGMSYLSASVSGKASTTVPALSGTNQKRRLGHISKVSGNYGLMVGHPELLSADSDGVAD